MMDARAKSAELVIISSRCYENKPCGAPIVFKLLLLEIYCQAVFFNSVLQAFYEVNCGKHAVHQNYVLKLANYPLLAFYG